MQSCDTHVRAGAEGALEAFVSVISGPPGPRPEAIFDNVGGPLLLLWGEQDTVTPLDGPVARFLKAAVDHRQHTDFIVLPGETCPHLCCSSHMEMSLENEEWERACRLVAACEKSSLVTAYCEI